MVGSNRSRKAGPAKEPVLGDNDGSVARLSEGSNKKASKISPKLAASVNITLSWGVFVTIELETSGVYL
jgi:hypothetical protein